MDVETEPHEGERHQEKDDDPSDAPLTEDNHTMELESILFPCANEVLPTLFSEQFESTAKQQDNVKEDVRDQRWMARYKQLIAYKNQNGHFNVPVTDPHASQPFSDWVRDQRRLNRDGKLRSDRKQLLEQIEFTWVNPVWMEKYNELLEFKEKHGHCKVPSAYSENPRLASWVRNLRCDQVQGILRADRKQLLDEIGFVWRKTPVEREREQLRQKIRKTKDSKLTEEELAIKRSMIEEEKKKQASESTTAGRKKKKQYEGLLHQKWMERYNELKAFYEQNGHFRVTDANGGQPLADWMRDQRRRQRDGKLQSYRKEQLDEINFVWAHPVWMDHYNQLLKFKEIQGHCRVPSTHENTTLKFWVKNQRHDQQAGKLRSDRKKLLDDIGFLWTASLNDDAERRWMQRYKELVAYKEKHGHCKVTRSGKKQNQETDLLAQWVLNQRRAKRRDGLRSDREKLLEDIGFDFSEPNRLPGPPKIQPWMFQYGYLPGICLMTANNKPYNALMAQARQNLESAGR